MFRVKVIYWIYEIESPFHLNSSIRTALLFLERLFLLLVLLKYWSEVGCEGLERRNRLLTLFTSSDSSSQLLKHHLNCPHLSKEAAAIGTCCRLLASLVEGRQQHSITLAHKFSILKKTYNASLPPTIKTRMPPDCTINFIYIYDICIYHYIYK